jgi:DNA-directed RNA polymerase subunit RPC12/RpoP
MNYKCPHCGEEIEVDDRIDLNVDDDYTESKMLGHCPDCERDYIWYDLYQYKRSFGFALAD